MLSTGSNRRWTPEEEAYLAESWGYVSFAGICNHLGRTQNAVIVKVRRMGLPPYLESGDYISVHQLLLALGYTGGDGYKLKSWVENRGFPVRKKRRGSSTTRVVYLDEFWEWAEKNRSFLDFSKMEPLALGEEPEWVAEQRRKDYAALSFQRKDPWTPAEDDRLKHLLKQHKYGYAELSDMLRRSAGAIQKRCNDLGLRERPVKAENHGKSAEWTEESLAILADGIRNGDSYTAVGRKVGKSEKAVRGKVYLTYLTEVADKVRVMIGDGPWGAGAPVPTVRQAVSHSGYRTEVRRDLSTLAALLRYRMNELGYEPYWQRFMCMKWHDIKGCAAGCTDCDSCTEFVRIKPQYCARCGHTFFERDQVGNASPWFIEKPLVDPDDNGGVYNVDPSTVGQYTGLTDKNDRRIFEGDVVKTHYANAVNADFVEVIVFHNGRFCAEGNLAGIGKCWATIWDGVPHAMFDKTVYMDSVEVIGNDDPELIENTEKEGAE